MALGTMPAAPVGDFFCIPIIYTKQVTTADVTTGPTVTTPCKCRIISMTGQIGVVGGTTVYTDIDLVIKNATESVTIGTIAVWNASATTNGGPCTPTAAYADLASGDVLEMEIDVTGGASPTVDGVAAYLWCVRE